MKGPAMPYKVEFTDEGQDLLWLIVDAKTGEITNCGPFHAGLYASQGCVVNLRKLTKCRLVHYRRETRNLTFKWPMVRLSLDGEIICEVSDNAA